VLAVYRVLSEAIARARRAEGPTFVELLTYRLAPHSTSDDPTRYRSEDEVDRWRQRDPIVRLRRHLSGLGILTDEQDAEIHREIAEEIARAVGEAEALGPPDRLSLFDDVYAEPPWHLVEQRDLLARTRGRDGSPGEGDGK